MQKTRLMTVAFAVAAAAGLAQAQFNVIVPNGTQSDPLANATSFGASPAATAVYGMVSFEGDLTEINTATYASEAHFSISVNGGAALDYKPSTTSGYTGTIHISHSAAGLFWANAGDNWDFDAFDSFDDGSDGLADSQWDNASFAFSGAAPAATSLGQLGANMTIDTNGSTADTELAVYTSDGQLIDTNDDNGGGGLWSLLNVSLTTPTTYWIVVGGYNSAFGDYLASSGTATGQFVLNINGHTVAAETLVGGDFFVYEFTIPTPGTAAMLGLGGLVAIRRRR